MVTLKQVKKELDDNYYPYKIHITQDETGEIEGNRFTFYKKYIVCFGMDKRISKKEMKRQIRNNYLVAIRNLKDRIMEDISDLAVYESFNTVKPEDEIMIIT